MLRVVHTLMIPCNPRKKNGKLDPVLLRVTDLGFNVEIVSPSGEPISLDEYEPVVQHYMLRHATEAILSMAAMLQQNLYAVTVAEDCGVNNAWINENAILTFKNKD